MLDPVERIDPSNPKADLDFIFKKLPPVLNLLIAGPLDFLSEIRLHTSSLLPQLGILKGRHYSKQNKKKTKEKKKKKI